MEEGRRRSPTRRPSGTGIWAHNVASLYEQATASQWDASADIRWRDLEALPSHLERAVCQIMTHLAENEYAALYVPARFIPRIHPHFAEVALFLATQVNDEARHIEAFTKRALANGGGLQVSSAMTQTSLRSLLEQEDFSHASFLLSVLGEGTFLEYLAFVERFAPEPVTAEIARRARIDEARHVAFGVEHARHYLRADPDRVTELFEAVRRRASFLADASGTSPHIEEAHGPRGGRGDAEPDPGRGRGGPRAAGRDAPAAGDPPHPARLPGSPRRGDVRDAYAELHVAIRAAISASHARWRYGTMATAFPPPTQRRTDVGTTPKRTPRSLAAVVLAAGQGKRLRSDLPKVLHPVCGRSILWHTLQVVRAAKPSRIVVVVGHGADDVREAVESWGIKPAPVFVEQADQLGTGHAVQLAEDAVGKAADVLVANGDFDPVTAADVRKLLSAHRRSGAAVTLGSTILDTPGGYGRVVATAGASSTWSRAAMRRPPSGRSTRSRRTGSRSAGTCCSRPCRSSTGRTASASTT